MSQLEFNSPAYSVSHPKGPSTPGLHSLGEQLDGLDRRHTNIIISWLIFCLCNSEISAINIVVDNLNQHRKKTQQQTGNCSLSQGQVHGPKVIASIDFSPIEGAVEQQSIGKDED